MTVLAVVVFAPGARDLLSRGVDALRSRLGGQAPAADDFRAVPDPGGWPGPTNTGVPSGTSLVPSESITVTEDGAVIDSLDVTGRILVQADDVTIRRTRVRSTSMAIRIDRGFHGLVVEDTELDGQGRADISAVGWSNYTLRRVNIHGFSDGPRIAGDNVVIESSYIHDLARFADSHNDTIQATSGRNIVIRDNNLQAFVPDTGDPMNSAIILKADFGPIDRVRVEGNLMNGGNYTVYARGGRAGENPPHPTTNVTFRDNRFGRDYRFGPVSSNVETTWTDNVWHDTGEPV